MNDPGSAYAGHAGAWAAGPARLYDALAEAVVEAMPEPVVQRHVVDIGAGTGSVARALLRRGASVTAVDTAPDMVDRMRNEAIDAVEADMLALPFEDATFDGAALSFVVSHTAEPARALSEARRVVRPDGVVCAAVFAAAGRHASKDAVDAVATKRGYIPPAWYVRFKQELEPLTNTAGNLRDVAVEAGLTDIDVVSLDVDSGIVSPQDIVASRLGMAHLAPFVSSLAGAERGALIIEAVRALGPAPEPLRPRVLVLRSRVGP
ncbi:MAG: class I SAM-dependent methyltransferase [Candidatus Dormibacteraeota bacterium]|nr:class I SAM-dependent methyltransferase [Candidatus Dormibacteraeota bacterium]